MPIYGDLPSLLDCIESLKLFAVPAKHDVLLVNDRGPDADAIEVAVLASIDGDPLFRYESNSTNLGFVGTCNRAALELDETDNDILLLNSDTVVTSGFLDEMHDVLYADERHGVVCARSNNATIASLPYRLTRSHDVRETDRTREVFGALAASLPRWYVSPVAMGFCFLTRRILIREHGLFDETFAPGYGEENDYCLRLNKAGHLSVIANRALVLHAGSLSFVGPQRNTLRDAHQIILEKRYPFYARAVRLFMRFGLPATERFADCLVPRDELPRVVVDIRGLRDAVSPDEAALFLDRLGRTAKAVAGRSADLEIIADGVDAARLALNPTRVRVRATAEIEDIAPIGLLLAEGVDTSRLAEANRRYATWGVLRATDGSDSEWKYRTSHAGNLLAQFDLLRHSEWVINLSGSTPADAVLPRILSAPQHSPREVDLAGVGNAWVSAMDTERTQAIERLEDRWQRFLTVDSAPSPAAVTDARVRQLTNEIESIRQSASYRIGNRLVTTAKRAVKR